MNSVWVLTQEYNLYDQMGEYFLAVFPKKPTHDDIKEFTEKISEYNDWLIQTGGGRIHYEDYWFNLREIVFN